MRVDQTKTTCFPAGNLPFLSHRVVRKLKADVFDKYPHPKSQLSRNI